MAEPSPLDSLYGLFAALAVEDPAAPAILAPKSETLGFGALVAQIDAARGWLRACGLGCHDKIALLAPRGPDTAVAAIATMCSAVCVPLNPLVTAAECETVFARTRARALLAPPATDSPAWDVARRRGLVTLEWPSGSTAPAGPFALQGAAPGDTDAPAGDDVALVVLTSGTTAEPKIVPSTHAALVARADKMRRLFGLGRGDRCLNLMPLCYNHGLSSGLIGPLAAGGSVICPTSVDADGFVACLRELAPTWFTAGASYHQAILDWLRARPGAVSGHRLRFARSASSPLAAEVHEEVERLLGVPVVEGFGTSEAGIVTSNPPHGPRKPGTVGVSPDGDVAVVDPDGAVLPPGEAGEVVVRGPTVIAGYEGDPDTNRLVFREGGYRTGDRGVLDADGYLTLVGRLSETINRGGEKIAPREVDAALLDHPAVAEAVAFAMPHPTLREDVAAAVRLHPDAGVTERELRRFLLRRLTPFKVPRRIVIAGALPTGPTGKPLRQGLAEHFGLASDATHRARPHDHDGSPMERILLALFREVLGAPDVGLDDDFFASGGDSLSAVDLIGRIEDDLRLGVPLLSLMEAPTARQLAACLEHHPTDTTRDVLGVNVGGRRRPVFGICGRYGYAVRLLLVGREIGPDQPFYGLQPPGMDWEAAGCRTIPEMAAHYAGRIRAIQPRGPYHLLGTSFGGLVVFEIALQLQAAGEEVDFLGLLDTEPATCRFKGRTDRSDALAVAEDEEESVAPAGPVEAAGLRVARTHVVARNAYVLERPFAGELTYFHCASGTVAPRRDRRRLWRWFASGGFRLLSVPGVHGTFHQEPQFSMFCAQLRACLAGKPVRPASAVEVFGRRYRLLRQGADEFILGSDGRSIRIMPNVGQGWVELRSVAPGRLRLNGWALDPERRQPADMVIVFLDGRYAGHGGLGIPRGDLERAFPGRAVRYCGFTLAVPLPPGKSERVPEARLFGVSPGGDVAAELRYLG